MEASSTDRMTFNLTDGDRHLGELQYENFFYLTAEIKLPNYEQYEIEPVGFFGTSLSLKKNGSEIASLKMNWRGQIVFSFQDGQEFLFKASGIFTNKFLIEDKEGEKLLQYEAHFNWSKFIYNYIIDYDKKPTDILLVFLGLYAANYFIATMSGATSGMS